jgi:hypothetical protein
MISIHPISPENEMTIAERLRDEISTVWPDVATSKRDHIDILVGVRTDVDVDLLVLVNLERAREIPRQRRRPSGTSPAAFVTTAVIVIEVKQLDYDCYDRIGNQLFPIYQGRREDRSVSKQANDAALGVSTLARRYGRGPFVHNVAWLTGVDDAALRDIEANVVGRSATWYQILDAAAQQRPFRENAELAVLREDIFTVKRILLNRRRESRRDRSRVEALSRNLASRAAVDALVSRAGFAQIRLIGRGGSGKTTSLALLAVQLAGSGQRVLILTFHHTLRSDIAHLVQSLGAKMGVRTDRIVVETMMNFVLSALDGLGAHVPKNGTQPDWGALDGVLNETSSTMFGDPSTRTGDIGRLIDSNPGRFAWDLIFVDESQDCSDGERDFLRALYGHKRLVLADGVDQLVRRQYACDWNVGVPEGERVVHRLETSLRMMRNIACFVNCFARALDFPMWYIAPQDQLPGGRVIIAVGEVDSGELLRTVVASAQARDADPADCLICLPPTSANQDPVRERLLAAGDDAKIALWDGTDPAMRANAVADTSAVRLVRYESCRGLEGWITVALDVDDFMRNKLRYPNQSASDPQIEPEIVANRWLLIPLTRAVQTLVIVVRDPQAPVIGRLRAALEDSDLPAKVVEWIDAGDLGRTIAPALV